MPTPLFHSSRPLPKTWLNRIFTLIYGVAVSVHLFRRCSTLIYSPTPISAALFVADLVLAFMWLTAQCFHWQPIERKVFPEKLREVVAESEFPAIDVMIFTADPIKEPPMGVVNTALSVMAFEYPPEKLSVYVSDDGGSELTLFAFMEGAKFAKHWIPYCKKHKIVDRVPEVYFETNPVWFPETNEIKGMYEGMKSRVEAVVQHGRVGSESEAFRHWTADFTRQHHPAVIQIILDNSIDKDVAGGVMPNLIYVSREKRKGIPHNFKAGALNALIRVSGMMTGAPILLTLDCDMYSNDPETPFRALCFFMDPSINPRLAFVQFPQRFSSINKNDIYACEFKPEMQILNLGMDGLLGIQFMGTGGYFNRHAISDSSSFGVTASKTHSHSKIKRSEDVLVSAHLAVGCNYEDNTKWGKEIGFRYGTVTEDTYTGYRLHCEGWKSICCYPERAAFLGGSPSTFNDALTQTKRWYTGYLEIFFNKYCPITYGIRSMNILHALCYVHYTLRAFYLIPVFIYTLLPQILLVNSVPIFTKVSEGGFFLYPFLFLGAYGKDFLDFVVFGKGTRQRWWSHQRMWLIWGLSSYPFALFEWSLKSFGFSTSGFNVTSKVIDEEQNKLYEQGVFDFGVESVLFFPMSVASLIGLVSFVKGVVEVLLDVRKLEVFFVQIFIAGFVVVNSWPIYEGMLLRSDRGRMPVKITLASMAIVTPILLASSMVS